MKFLTLAAIAGLSFLSVAPAGAQSAPDAPFQVAQMRSEMGDRGYRDRDRTVVRVERSARPTRHHMRMERRDRCRVIVTKRQTPRGMVTVRERRCR